MDIEDKDLAVKIFDYFFKKAGVIKVEVINRNQDGYGLFKFSKTAFGLSAGIYIKNPAFYVIRGVKFNTNQNFMTFNASDSCIDLIHACNLKTFKLAKMPNKLKEAVVESCIKQKMGCGCVTYNKNYRENITLIPQASSLEELAIKMELET